MYKNWSISWKGFSEIRHKNKNGKLNYKKSQMYLYFEIINIVNKFHMNGNNVILFVAF